VREKERDRVYRERAACVHTCMRERVEEDKRVMWHKKSLSRRKRDRARHTLGEKVSQSHRIVNKSLWTASLRQFSSVQFKTKSRVAGKHIHT
jgi:hypothetical protein